MTSKEVKIVYTNYRGETSERVIVPKELFWGKNEWHPEEQWLLLAFDVGKSADRTFAVKDIKKWS